MGCNLIDCIGRLRCLGLGNGNWLLWKKEGKGRERREEVRQGGAGPVRIILRLRGGGGGTLVHLGHLGRLETIRAIRTNFWLTGGRAAEVNWVHFGRFGG